MPGTLDLDVYRGDGFSLSMALQDDAGLPLDISTSTFAAQIRTSIDAVPYLDMTVDVDGSVVTLTLTSEQTALLVTDSRWDLEQRPDDLEPRTLLAGKVTVTRDVTR